MQTDPDPIIWHSTIKITVEVGCPSCQIYVHIYMYVQMDLIHGTLIHVLCAVG